MIYISAFVLEYLKSVLDDFGLKDVTDFQNMIDLLQVNESDFEQCAQDKPARMVTAIRTMRHI